MQIDVLLVATSNRSLGYISQKSKKSIIDKMVRDGLITNLVQQTRLIWIFDLEPVNLTEVERRLNRGHICFRKIRGFVPF